MKTSFVIGVVLLSLFTVIHANWCELPQSANVTCIAEGAKIRNDTIYEACGTTELFNVTDADTLIESLEAVSTQCSSVSSYKI